MDLPNSPQMNNIPEVGGSVPPVVVEGEALSESQKVDANATEAAISDAHNADDSSVEVRNADVSNAEISNVNVPNVEISTDGSTVVEIPEVEAPTIETHDVQSLEQPKTAESEYETTDFSPPKEISVEEIPVVAAPTVETPVEETSVVEPPVVETPSVEAPSVGTPIVDTPADTPAVDAPARERPEVDPPIVEESVIEIPIQQTLPLPLPLPIKTPAEERHAGGQKRKTKKPGIGIEPTTDEPALICEAAIEKPVVVDQIPAVIAKLVSMTQRSTAQSQSQSGSVAPSVDASHAVPRAETVSPEKTENGNVEVEGTETVEDFTEEETITLSVNAEQLIENASGGEVAPSDGIEILVQLALKGEIDPKNVDIIDVTDKFLKLIAAAPKENLRQSGKILFHACVLLRMKAEALLSNAVEEESGGDDFLDFDENGDIIDSDSYVRQITLKDLEKAIVRRSQRRQVRKRQVTLEELINALREAERIEKTRSEKKPARAVIELAGQHEVDGVDDLLDLAHDEDVESTIEKVEMLLARILKLGEKIELLQMVVLMDDHNDWVDAFLASLFLSNAGKIDLYQDEFYGPLFIGLGGSSVVSDTVVT